MAPDTTYVGAVDTNNGTTIAIGTSADLIRIDTSSDENELTIDAARALIARLAEAINDAEDWTVSHPDAEPCPVCLTPAGQLCNPAIPGPIEDGRHV